MRITKKHWEDTILRLKERIERIEKEPVQTAHEEYMLKAYRDDLKTAERYAENNVN